MTRQLADLGLGINSLFARFHYLYGWPLRQCALRNLIDCFPEEIVYLSGNAPMTLGEAVNRVMFLRCHGLLADTKSTVARLKLAIYRQGRKTPSALDINDVEQLALRPDFRAPWIQA